MQAFIPDCEALPEDFEDKSINGLFVQQQAMEPAGLSNPQEDQVKPGAKMELTTGDPQSTPGDKGEAMTAEQAEALLQVFSNPLYSARQPTQAL